MTPCRVEFAGGVFQVALRDDIIALEHRARLVLGQVHRNAFGDAAADHRAAVRRRSWGMRPGHPVALQALFHALAKLTDAARLLCPAPAFQVTRRPPGWHRQLVPGGRHPTYGSDRHRNGPRDAQNR